MPSSDLLLGHLPRRSPGARTVRRRDATLYTDNLAGASAEGFESLSGSSVYEIATDMSVSVL